jgi:hypothetical protein
LEIKNANEEDMMILKRTRQKIRVFSDLKANYRSLRTAFENEKRVREI